MTRRTYMQQIMTLPNLMSLLRIALIPMIIAAFASGSELRCAMLIILSGLTDVVDGWIARHWNAVSDVGKVLDPVADKLTQLAMLWMLLSSHPLMALPLAVLVIRESVMACTGLICVVRTREVRSARWHGKITTLLLYTCAFVHILWQEIPAAVSNTLIGICVLAQLVSLVMYTWDNICCIRQAKGGS